MLFIILHVDDIFQLSVASQALFFSCQPSVASTLYFPVLLKYLGKDLPAEYRQEVRCKISLIVAPGCLVTML